MCMFVVVLSLIVFDFSLLPHRSMKLQGQASYGGCRADIHSPTHVQCPCKLTKSWAKYLQGPVDVTWAVLLAAKDDAIPLRHELGTWARGCHAVLASPTISTMGVALACLA